MNTLETPLCSVAQPWAAAIIEGHKTVENRTWMPQKPSGHISIKRALPLRLWIHASRKDLAQELLWYGEDDAFHAEEPTNPSHAALAAVYGSLSEISLTTGAVLGSATLVDAHPDTGCCRPWGEASFVDRLSGEVCRTVYHWLLEDPEPLEAPIPAKGRLGLWLPDTKLALELHEALQ